MTLKRSKVIVDDTERREDSIELSWKYDDNRLMWLLSFFSSIKEVIRKLCNGLNQTDVISSNSSSSKVIENLKL
jgi:hypothetical protein